jgi:hypothetical protein
MLKVSAVDAAALPPGSRFRSQPRAHGGSSHFPSGHECARARARGHQLGEHVDRHARAAKHRQPAEAAREICGDRAGQRHAGQLVRQYQARGDDLAVVEPQLGQLIQPQFEEVHSVWSPVTDAAGGARGEQRVPREADLFGQLALCR